MANILALRELFIVILFSFSNGIKLNATSIIFESQFNKLPIIKNIILNDEAINCDNVILKSPRGTIKSPGYPLGYKNSSSCLWNIIGQEHQVITISFDDLDIEVPQTLHRNPFDANELSRNEPCIYNWVKIGSIDGYEQKYCGFSQENLILTTYKSPTNQVWVKFHVSAKVKGGRGFHLTYLIGNKKSLKCKDDEFHCSNGKCILAKWRCNRKNECEDASDEKDCDDICLGPDEQRCSYLSHSQVPGCYSFLNQQCDGIWDCKNGADERGCGGCPNEMFVCRSGSSCYSEAKRCDGVVDCPDYTDELNCGYCGINETQCGPTTMTHCYNPFTQRCNLMLDCPNGEDEKGCIQKCPNKILCLSESGCYSHEERCNGVPFCNDLSDEKNCSIDLCQIERGGFLCANGHCIRSLWVCDRSDDCGDGTDEINCLKNSVITAAIMGSLICGLLLVIAISCTCKLLALKQTERHHISSQSSPLHFSDTENSILGYNDSPTHVCRVGHGFCFREPPPSYSAAVGNTSDRESTYFDQIRQIRRQRRLRRNRRRPPTPPPAFSDGSNSTTECSSPTTTTVTSSLSNDNSIIQTGNSSNDPQSDSDKDESLKETNTPNNNTNSASNSSPLQPSSSPSNLVHIELNNIPSLSLSFHDCDSEPLIS